MALENQEKVQLLNTKVIFNAQKTRNNVASGYLTFNQVEINIGDGFNQSSGVFTAPIGGIYKMSFSGITGVAENSGSTSGWVNVHKNELSMFGIYDLDNTYGEETYVGRNLAYTWMMKLIKGDKLKLNSYNIHAEDLTPVTFTGELIRIED